MFQLLAGAFTIVADILNGLYGWSGATIEEIQPSPYVEFLPKTVCGLQLSVLAIGSRDDLKGTTWAHPFMGLQERMKPADTSYSFDIALLGNLSRGTNVAFKVAGLVNYDAIIEKHSKTLEDEMDGMDAPGEKAKGLKKADAKEKPSKSVQAAQPWKADKTERNLDYLHPAPPDYEGQPTGSETGVFFAGAANVMMHSEVNGLQIAGLVNFADEMNGLQIAGLSNTARVLHGLQLAAWCNETDEGCGVQIGLFNNGRQMKGVQIGLLNFLRPKDSDGRFLPLVNAQF